jgi:hypothetical protein
MPGMCRQCDEFEPVVMEECLNDPDPMRLVEHLAGTSGRICITDMKELGEVTYQCTACRRAFLFSPNAADGNRWKVLSR